jgi:SAM-dependent methyltransferase
MKLNRWGYSGKIFLLATHFLKGKVNIGRCSVCDRNTFFILNGNYDRDNYECLRCGSLPRQRMLMLSLNKFIPNWKTKVIHETSPGSSSSYYIAKNCSLYTSSQYFLNVKPGDIYHGTRCENLEKLTFGKQTFDIFISQEVLEHVFHPDLALAEITRVLKIGGYHVFTTPYRNWTKTVQRAKLDLKGEVVHLESPEYHGNPVGNGKSLVTFDWGYNFLEYVKIYSKMDVQIYSIIDENLGLRGELLEVFVCRKLK